VLIKPAISAMIRLLSRMRKPMLDRIMFILVASFLLALSAILISLAVAVVGFALSVATVKNAYAAEIAGDMFVSYLNHHQDGWPHGWEDLDGEYSDATRRVPGPMPLDGVKQRIKIDFSVTREQFSRDPSAVLFAFHEGGGFFEGAEPNEMVRRRLKQMDSPPK